MREITQNEAQMVAGGTIIDSYTSAIGTLGGTFGVLGGVAGACVHFFSPDIMQPEVTTKSSFFSKLISKGISSDTSPISIEIPAFVTIFAGIGMGFAAGAIIGSLYHFVFPGTD